MGGKDAPAAKWEDRRKSGWERLKLTREESLKRLLGSSPEHEARIEKGFSFLSNEESIQIF